MIDKGVCNKGFIWNPSNSECDKSCDVGEYLDYENLDVQEKKMLDKLVEKCIYWKHWQSKNCWMQHCWKYT